MKEVYLLANAHIDPVWQWGIKEGIATTLSTFRSAANLLENNDTFVFCHNEALLYKWVKEYDVDLFKRIKKLVKCGKWHIMGGFELQPDCVMPSGEAMIRQIGAGHKFFLSEFGKVPKVAVSMDCFGHSRGLVQILVKCGYTGYIFFRSNASTPKEFIWQGYDGSQILAHRLQAPYGTKLGHALDELKEHITHDEDAVILFPWGVGNHGGGPSQKDLNDLGQFSEAKIKHSYPEEYFDIIQDKQRQFPVVKSSLMPVNVGGYASIARIKQAYRELENKVITAEKMSSVACKLGIIKYPYNDLESIWERLLFLQFHDVLPGTITKPVVKSMLEKAGGSLDEAERLIDKAFFALSTLMRKAKPNEIPILVYNPHPYKVKQIVECEFNLQDQNRNEDEVTFAQVMNDKGAIPSQMKKEDSTIPIDWRKRVAFAAELEPMAMNRFSVDLILTKKEKIKFESDLVLRNKDICAIISEDTGFIDSLLYHGKNLTGGGIGQIVMYEDTPDPWNMTSDRIGKLTGKELKLLKHPTVVTDGAVVKEILAVFTANGVTAEVLYSLPKDNAYIGINVKLVNTNHCKAYRIQFPFVEKTAQCEGETMFGVDQLYDDGTENASQRFDIIRGNEISLGIINTSVYSGCYKDGILEKTILRAPVYCAHPIPGRELLDDNIIYDYDGIGEFSFEFGIMPVDKGEEYLIAREACVKNEPPIAVSCFPTGTNYGKCCDIKVDGNILVSSIKMGKMTDESIVHVYEPVGIEAEFTIEYWGTKVHDKLQPFEVRALCFTSNGCVTCDLTR